MDAPTPPLPSLGVKLTPPPAPPLPPTVVEKALVGMAPIQELEDNNEEEEEDYDSEYDEDEVAYKHRRRKEPRCLELAEESMEEGQPTFPPIYSLASGDEGAVAPPINDSSLPPTAAPSGYSLPKFSSATKLPASVIALNATSERLIHDWLPGRLLDRQELAEFKDYFPRPDHPGTLPAEPDAPIVRILTHQGLLSKSLKADAELREMHASLLRVCYPLFAVASLNEERQVSQSELRDTASYLFSALSHAMMRTTSLRRKAILQSSGLSKLPNLWRKLEISPLVLTSLTEKPVESARSANPTGPLLNLLGPAILQEIKDAGSETRSFSADVQAALASIPVPSSSGGSGSRWRFSARRRPSAPQAPFPQPQQWSAVPWRGTGAGYRRTNRGGSPYSRGGRSGQGATKKNFRRLRP